MAKFPSVAVLLIAFLASFVSSNGQRSQNTIERDQQAYTTLVYPRIFDSILVDRPETPVQFRALLYLNLANWNAWCNYHPTAADSFGRTRFKRPLSEHTLQNKNTATMYALLRIYESSPQSFGGADGLGGYRNLFRELNLDPDDRSQNMSTPVGIGNREGMDLARLMKIDGWNAQGDQTSSDPQYAQFFADTTSYAPVNTPWRITFPFRWQPLLENNGLGFFFRQEHVVPQAGSGIAMSLSPADVRRRRVPSPYRNSFAPFGRLFRSDIRVLSSNAKKVFQRSAQLTEEKRLLAELLDNKLSGFRTKENPFGTPSIGVVIRFGILGPRLDLSLDNEIIYGLATNIAVFDAMVTVWKEKLRHDAIRPTGQTMKMLFGDRKFEVWGGPGKPNTRIRAGEWLPYIRTMPHSEYPSASSCVCRSIVEHALIFTNGRDDFPFNLTFPKGSSKIYPGQVPSEEVTLTINRLTDWDRLCAQSRLDAGVHFEPSIEAGRQLCSGIGRSAQDTVDTLLSGKSDFKFLKWLPTDVERFWEED